MYASRQSMLVTMMRAELRDLVNQLDPDEVKIVVVYVKNVLKTRPEAICGHPSYGTQKISSSDIRESLYPRNGISPASQYFEKQSPVSSHRRNQHE